MRVHKPLLLLLLAPSLAVADGKFFGIDRAHPRLPFQRAAIFFAGGRETLLVQS